LNKFDNEQTVKTSNKKRLSVLVLKEEKYNGRSDEEGEKIHSNLNS